MVGDDIASDVRAAQPAGLPARGQAGKYLPQTHQAAPGAPDHVIESIADLPALLAGRGARPACPAPPGR